MEKISTLLNFLYLFDFGQKKISETKRAMAEISSYSREIEGEEDENFFTRLEVIFFDLKNVLISYCSISLSLNNLHKMNLQKVFCQCYK